MDDRLSDDRPPEPPSPSQVGTGAPLEGPGTRAEVPGDDPAAAAAREDDPAAAAAPPGAERVGRRAGKNTLIRAVGEIVGKLASLVLFGALARAVGQAEIGIFVFAFAYLQIVTMPVGLGMDRLLVRRVAKDRSRLEELMDVLGVKVAVGIPVALAGVGLIALGGYDERTLATVALLAPGLLIDSFARSLFSIFTAVERSGLLSVSVVVQRVLAAALGLVALGVGLGVVAVAATYTIGATAGLVVAGVLAARRVGLPAVAVRRSEWRRLSRLSLPFAVQDIFGVLLAKVDVVILSLLATEAAVGRYGGAYRLLEATFFLTSSVNGAFAAMYTYLGPTSDPSLSAVVQRSIKLLLAFLTPCAVVLGVLAEPVSVAFLGAGFEQAAVPLRLLAPSVVLIGVVYLGTSLLVSRGNPRAMVVLSGVGVALNVVLNLMLVPALGDRGAAAAMLLTEIALATVVLVLARRAVGSLRWASMAVGPIVAGLVMGLAMAPVADSLLPALPLGVAAYFAVLVGVERLLSPDDLRFVVNVLRRRITLRAGA